MGRLKKNALKGLTVTLTGGFSAMKRKEATALCEKAGAKVSGSVGKKTNLLVAGEKSGSKVDKANKLGIPVISEAALYSRLGIGWPVTEVDGPLAGWLERFLAMVDMLRAHPEVEILNLHIGPPATDSKIKTLKSKGHCLNLAPDLPNFYRQCDGLSFAWIHKKDPRYLRLGDLQPPLPLSFGPLVRSLYESAGATGGLYIPPIREVFKDCMLWEIPRELHPKKMTWGGEEMTHHSFSCQMYKFDFFNLYTPFYLYTRDRVNFTVHMAEDYGPAWNSSKVSGVEAYLEAALAQYTSHQHRSSLYAHHGSNGSIRLEEDRAHWEANPTTLSEILDRFSY